ncbi:MAG: S41 family peptidase, partial [Smithellaceae bacterium]|nr:S41 family peptidase [Smithellaceae bacterium]
CKPIKGIILDMRNNPGGLLNQAVEVSDLFLKSGVIVSTRGRVKTAESKFMARDDGDEPSCPVVVMVNEGTASAAEIVSGALQDNGRAVVLGTQTFGKGSVQTVIPLDDGAALKLTTAKYYTPAGRSIQAEGIAPDIIVKYVKPADEKEPTANAPIREKDLKGHIKSLKEGDTDGQETPEDIQPETPPIKDVRGTEDPSKDNQLKEALDVLKSWDVFSRGSKKQ